jgi:hypothetical protein
MTQILRVMLAIKLAGPTFVCGVTLARLHQMRDNTCGIGFDGEQIAQGCIGKTAFDHVIH